MPSSTDTSCKLYGFLEKTQQNPITSIVIHIARLFFISFLCPTKYPHQIPIISELTRYVTPIHDGYIYIYKYTYTVYHPYELPITLVNPSMILVIPIDGPMDLDPLDITMDI